MFPTLIFVTHNAYMILSWKEAHCYFFVEGLREMLYDIAYPQLTWSIIFLTNMQFSVSFNQLFFFMLTSKSNILFQGGKIRSKLAAVLSDAEGIVIEEGSAGDAGKAAAQAGMRK